MLRDVLIEIGLEELPFIAMKQVLEEMPKAFCKWLDEQYIVREDAAVWVTPRRIVFLCYPRGTNAKNYFLQR